MKLQKKEGDVWVKWYVLTEDELRGIIMEAMLHEAEINREFSKYGTTRKTREQFIQSKINS